MATDKRYVRVNGAELLRLRELAGFTPRTLARATTGLGIDSSVSEDSINRYERDCGTRAQRQKILFIVEALNKKRPNLNVTIEMITLDFAGPPLPAKEGQYSWKNIEDGAKEVAKYIFSEEKGQQFDAVLTFPGASTIFAGLVLRSLPLEVFLRIPVYTGLFMDATTKISTPSEYLRPINVVSDDKKTSFRLLLPRGLTEGTPKRVVVIDDVIMSGGVMQRLRTSLAKNLKSLQFACCIVFVGHTAPNRMMPEIIGLKDRPPEARPIFPLPWGDSYSFEDAFRVTHQSGRRNGD